MKKTTAIGARIALVVGPLANGVCFGQSAESLVECTHVAGESARLQCYDDHMTRLGHKIAADVPAVSKRVPTATAAAPSLPAQAAAAASKQTDFGIAPETLRKKRAAETLPDTESPRELVARVKAVSERAHGELRVELDNDQVWVETQRTGDIAVAVGETVTIKHGTFGSYFLTRQSGRALRVQRIR